MKCPECLFKNREGAKFCNECGHKFEIQCPECNSPNRVGSKFCDECGCKLSASIAQVTKQLSFDEKLDKIQLYLPKGLTEKILSQRGRIEGERKQITVMFCDMEGFTQLTAKLGPEETYAIMDQVYETLIHKVHDYEGTVNEFTGDGVMALFGAPIALEDAPQRAIRSAYAIHREMSRFSDKMKQGKSGMPPLKMRVGVHTGPVVVGTLGNDLRVEFKAVGDTVNLASRMEGLAEPGSTYVTEDTYKLTEGLFRFEALGQHTIKGKAGKIKAYRVIAPSTSRTRFDVSAERGLTPFVGRRRELDLLLDGFERSKKGRGQAFSIVAEAGVGKSRLLYEFRKAVSNEDVTFQEGKCLSYSRGVVYHPVIDVVRSNFDIVESDDDAEIRSKLKRGLKIIDANEVHTLPYLLELLGIKNSGLDPRALSPEARKDKTINAIKHITMKVSQIRPLIVAIEDLHWIDKNSEDYLKDLLVAISGARLFLIFTYRPEYVHSWGAKSYHSQVNLNRLSNRESLVMASHLLNAAEIHEDLENLILEKAEGVPFFIEEFIRSLKDLEIIKRKDGQYVFARDLQEITIPSTIQDVIMARVDALPDSAKELLQIGSVIEREFSHKLIMQVSGLSEKELLSQVSMLRDAEILFERGIYPDNAYIFKHALTQEVVYDSILARKKKELHDKIGKAIEQFYTDNLHEHYGGLAEHFIKSENFENGSNYCRLAAKKAEKAASLNDAITYSEKQIECLERLPRTAQTVKSLIDARTALGLFYAQMGRFVRAKAICDPIITLAESSDYKRRISHIYCILGVYSAFCTVKVTTGLEYFKKALKIGSELSDPLTLVLANTWMGNCLSSICEFDKALDCHNKALEINVAANTQWGISAIQSWIALTYFSQGNINLAYKNSSEAIRIAEESGDIFSKAHAYTAHGISCYGKGNIEEAKLLILEAIDLSEKIELSIMLFWAHKALTEIYFDVRKHEASQKHCQILIAISKDYSEYSSFTALYKLALLRGSIFNNANIDLESIYALSYKIKHQFYKSESQRYIGEILLVSDESLISEAEEWIKRSIETDQKYGMMWYLARDYALYAKLCKRKGKQANAGENLKRAIQIFKECGADGWVGKYQKELAEL